MNPKVLIVSSIYDFSCDLVCLRLGELGVPFFRLNREKFKDYSISLKPTVPLLNIHGKNFSVEIGSGLKSIFFRQPVFLRNTPPYPLSPEEQLERSQWTAFIRSLSVFDFVKWMNFPKDTYLAESKPYQLLVAKRCGLEVPMTVLGNSKDSIETNFNNRNFVLKSLDTVLIRDESDCLFTYTTINSMSDIRNDSLYSAPLLFQEYLSPKIDIRVTIVGNEIFSVNIMSDGMGIECDWRTIPRGELEYENTTLSPAIMNSLINLKNVLRLSYAAIDLIQTSKRIYFIEVNPTGEWGWLCSDNRQIDLAIATWLANKEMGSK